MPPAADGDVTVEDASTGQSLLADEDLEIRNANPNEFDERPAECTPFGPTPPFELVSGFFEILTSLRNKTGTGSKGSSEKKRARIDSMFKRWRSDVGNDLYPLVRLILPDRDRYRATYGIKEQVLAKIYIQVLGLTPKSASAHRLLHWKQPTKDSSASGDFAEVACSEIRARSTIERSTMTIEEVNEQLDLLSRTSKLDEKVKVMSVFHDSLTAEQQKWLIRIILKDLKISLGEKMVLSCIHRDAIDLFNVCSDLRAVCWKLWDPTKRLPNEDNTVQLFRAFRPMLCNRNKNDFEDIVKTMGSTKKSPKAFLIEEKLDGERIQLHKKGEEYRYYSRKDKDYTYLYGLDRTASDAALTPFIHHCFNEQIEEIILDGEMVVREPITGLYLKFGNLKTTAINKIFDVVYAKGKGRPGRSLLEEPLQKRREIMLKLVKPEYGRIEYAESRQGYTAKEIKEELSRILDKQGEGLVIKNLDSVYTLHGREDDWIKVKPEYMDSLGEEVDVLVMGGYWGTGRQRGGILGSFMCGVLDDGDPDHPKYVSFCKVGSGFSMEDFETIAERLRGKWKQWQKNMPDPEGLIFGAEKPDVWISPKDSFLVAVKAAEITTDALNYGAEICLRFPRVQKIRWDLKPEDCHKYQVDFLTMASNNRGEKEIADAFSKRQKFTRRTAKATVASAFKGADVKGLQVSTAIFQDLLFYVVEGVRLEGKEVEGHTKQDLEKMIVANGGKRWQRLPKNGGCYVICSRTDFLTIQNIMKQDPGHDVIHPNWIVESVAAGRRLALRPEYYVHMTNDTADRLGDPNNVRNDSVSEGEEKPVTKSKKRPAPSSSPEKSESPDLPPIKKESPQSRKTSYGRPGVQRKLRDREGDSSSTDNDTSTAEESEGPVDPDRIVKSEDEGRSLGPSMSEIRHSGIGAFTKENAYDEEQIFKNLVFYLDTSANATHNNLPASKEDSVASDNKLSEAEQKLIVGGGKVVQQLDEQSLTHIVVGSDASRVVELSRRTREPRARRIVTVNWVEDSTDMENLQEESWYAAYAG